MKASEMLSAALVGYGVSSFMCHELDYMVGQGKGSKGVRDFLTDKIHSLLMPHETIVLHNLLRYTNKRYEGYNKRYGHNCDACYKMRIAFWEQMIIELKEQGL